MCGKAPLSSVVFFAVFLIGGSAACREPLPPPSISEAGLRDAGPNPIIDGGASPFGRQDGGPRLPSVDREIVLPYLGPAEEELLEVEGEVGTLDVFFSIDTTGSFGGEIDNLQSALRSRIVPSLRDRVSDVSFGVGRFEDFPTNPFGAASDRPFRLLSRITGDDAAVASAVAGLDQPLGSGGDGPESGAEALWQITTGAGYPDLVPAFDGRAARGGGDLGGVGFRADALRVVVHVTDAPSHEPADYGVFHPDTHSIAEVVSAMNDLGVRAVGVASGSSARRHLEALALGTGAVVEPTAGSCATGVDGAGRAPIGGVCPLVFDVLDDGSGLATAVVDAIADLLSTIRYDEVWGETDDGLGFVQAIEAAEATVPADVPPPGLADRRPPDTIDDTFTGVGPGTVLRFRAVLRNESIPPADYDQVFRLELRVVGDGVTLLTRTLRVVVPRGRPDGGMSDGGMSDGGPSGDAGIDAGPAAVDAGP